MPTHYRFRCEACGFTGIRYRNVRKCPACGEHKLFRMEPRPGLTASAVLDALVDLFNEIELSPEEVDEELRRVGYDPDEVAERFRSVAEPLLEQKREGDQWLRQR